MARWATAATFDRRYRKLSHDQKAAFKRAALALSAEIDANGFAFKSGGPLDLHLYSGFVSPPSVWSMDWGTGNNHRAIFTVENGDIVMWRFLGAHDEIDRWQHETGPKGLQAPGLAD